MRILAIRGENLASLAQRFEIDFETGPLRGAGLFAITGETGAGKSTILDALCLALYDEFPRISAEGADEHIPDPSGKSINATDPRSILTRGAGRGFAEVDFLGRDGERYRARCDLHRERGRASGNLQKRGRSLFRLGEDGAIVAAIVSGIDQVKKKIVELTDLTFDQFRRTVLLAQGDFDAFLRANANERAELLEKITGSSIYAKISKKVYERAREAAEAVARFEQRRADIGLGLLDDETRAALDLERADLERQRERCLLARDAILALLRRHETIARAETRLAEAVAEHEKAAAAAAAMTSAREALRDIERAEPLRAPLERLQGAETALADALDAEARATAAAAEASAAFDAALAGEHDAIATLEEAEAAVTAFAPVWSQAEKLDSQIAVAAEEEGRAVAIAAAAEKTAREKEEGRARLASREATVRAGLDEARPALAQLASAEPLSKRWSEIAEWLQKRGEFKAQLAENVEKERERARDIERDGAQLAVCFDADLKDQRAREDIRRKIATRSEALAAIGENAAAEKARDLENLRELVSSLSREAARHSKAETARDRAARDLDAAAGEAEAQKKRIAAAREERRLHEASHEEIERLGDLADAAASREAMRLRASLVAGEPCPVCGATDHPHARSPDAANLFVDELRRRRDELRAAFAETDRVIAEASAREAAAGALVEDAIRRRAEADAAIAEAERLYAQILASWPAGATLSGVAPPATIGGAGASLQALGLEIEAERRSVAVKTSQARTLREEIESLRNASDERGAAIEARRFETDDIAKRLAEARNERARCVEASKAASERLESIDRTLSPYLLACDLASGDLDRDPEGARRVLERKGAEYRDAEARKSDLEAELGRLAPLVATAEAEARAAAEAATDHRGRANERGKALAALRERRAALFEGETTASHRGRFEERRKNAHTARDDAAAKRASSAAGRAAGEATLSSACANLDKARAAQETARDAHASALARTGLDESAVRTLLATPVAESQEMRDRIERTDATAAAARAATTARQRDLDEAVGAGRPADDGAALEAQRGRCDETLETLARRAGEIGAAVAADDEARAKTNVLSAEIERAKALHKTWAQVDSAIGSANGDKFRRFAQSVTLDCLVALANRHLAALSPRYRLERAASDGADLGLQIIDRDLLDERRSTRSLSGGERFLASLALALALCGLEGRESFVDTLFIDEGFGALDAATLDVAIDALEALQGQGRKVGLISHVESLHQRIPVQIRVEKRGGGRSTVHIGATAIGLA